MAGYPWISFTTDYGLSDGFVAACHGVIARLAPAVRVIDVTHLVHPGDITHGAAVLAQTVGHLPPAVHLAVVDPGVGTSRRAIALDTPAGLLVGPDNGLLPWAADTLGGVRSAVELTNPAWFGSAVSRTFHGRDIFAPAAARLALGAPLADAGPSVDPSTLVRLPDPVVEVGAGWLAAEVLTVDRFGNVQLAAPAEALAGLGPVLTVGAPADGGRGGRADGGGDPGGGVDGGAAPGRGVAAVRGETFGSAPPGGLVVYVDSADRVAIAVNGGRAAVVLSVEPGDVLRIARATGPDHRRPGPSTG